MPAPSLLAWTQMVTEKQGTARQILPWFVLSMAETQISSLRGEGQVDGAKRTAPYSQWTSRKLMKGTPTLAPMTPAKSEDCSISLMSGCRASSV
eukprot:g24028.t1